MARCFSRLRDAKSRLDVSLRAFIMTDLLRYLWQSRVMTPLYRTPLKSCFWRKSFHLKSRHLHAPLSLRYGTSDLNVFWQCFVRQEYAGCLEWPKPRYILDCGANVGFASALSTPSCVRRAFSCFCGADRCSRALKSGSLRTPQFSSILFTNSDYIRGGRGFAPTSRLQSRSTWRCIGRKN